MVRGAANLKVSILLQAQPYSAENMLKVMFSEN